MTLDEGQSMVRQGASFRAVYPALYSDNDRLLFKEWWLRESGVPAKRIDSSTAGRLRIQALGGLAVPTGDTCGKCGGLMVQTGKCKTCQGCGESSGGCS